MDGVGSRAPRGTRETQGLRVRPDLGVAMGRWGLGVGTETRASAAPVGSRVSADWLARPARPGPLDLLGNCWRCVARKRVSEALAVSPVNVDPLGLLGRR